MARATGYVIEEEVDPFNGKIIGRYKNPIPVTIELERGMKLIGERERCKYWCETVNTLVLCSAREKTDGYNEYLQAYFCPCHNWKARKK